MAAEIEMAVREKAGIISKKIEGKPLERNDKELPNEEIKKD